MAADKNQNPRTWRKISIIARVERVEQNDHQAHTVENEAFDVVSFDCTHQVLSLNLAKLRAMVNFLAEIADD